jgi:hypothetical protein
MEKDIEVMLRIEARTGTHGPRVFRRLAELFLLLGVGACGILGPDDSDSGVIGPGDSPEPGDVKVLFIGASYVAAWDLPWLFDTLAYEAGKQVWAAGRVQPGFYLDFFAQDAVTAAAIQDQDWDFVIVSGGCQTAAYPDTHHELSPNSGYHPVYPSLATLKQAILENHPQTVMIYMMPWAFEDGLLWVQGETDTYADMQLRIRENTVRWADSLDITLAPVGMAWNEIMKGDPPQHYLFTSDWNHPSRRGSYLTAVTLFATVFKENAEGNSFHWVLESEEAETFQRVGSRTVLDSLALWNIR